jgi:energy-coupling factor transporter ATP-binding protein EcfA2
VICPNDKCATRIIDSETTVSIPTLSILRNAPVDPSEDSRRRDPIEQLRDDLDVVLGAHTAPGILLFLLSVARYAGRACSAALVGPSGGGKTTVATRVTGLLPPEDTRYVIEVTYAALTAGFGWDSAPNGLDARAYDFRQKLLVVDENADVRDLKTMACLRQATSTEWTRRAKMERGQSVTTALQGPLTLVDCRLSTADVDYQTSNRLVPILLPHDPDALQTIMDRTACRPTLAGRRQVKQIKEISGRWHRFIRGLDNRLDVVIEFADQIQVDVRSSIGGRITHGPRLLTAVHSLISAIAWLRQGAKRRLRPDGGSAVIFATRADYQAARSILLAGNVIDERPAIPAPALHVFRLWQSKAADDGNRPVTAPALYQRIGVSVDRGNMTRHMKPLVALELVRELAGRNGNGQKQYDLTSVGLRASSISLLHTLPTSESIKIENEDAFNAMVEK